MTNVLFRGMPQRGGLQTGLKTLVALFAVAAGMTCAAKTVYVDSAREDDSGDGLDWSTAKRTIQAAVDLAEKKDTVLIAAGTYLLDEAVEFKGKDLELKGATGNAADVIVDGQGKCPCIKNYTYNGMTPQVMISSLTVQNGFSSEESGIAGGITSQNMALITNCVVRNCYHGVSGMKCSGGGMYLVEASDIGCCEFWLPSGLFFSVR